MTSLTRRSALAVAFLAVAACSGSDSTSVNTTPTTSATTVPTTVAAPATTAPPPPVPPTTVPRSADALAGARVLCSYPDVNVPEDLLTRLRQGKAAGVLWYGENLPDLATATANAAAIQKAVATAPDAAPAIIATDQEGGTVRRIPGPPEASAQTLGTQGPATIQTQATAAAIALRQWGINVDFAPVADLGRSGSFLAAQQRSFGTDPTAVSAGVVAFVRGLHDGRVAATLKHFPGLGAATTNTDLATSVVNVPADVLRSTDLPPFVAGIDAATDLVMMSSAQYPALDSVPAVVSLSDRPRSIAQPAALRRRRRVGRIRHRRRCRSRADRDRCHHVRERGRRPVHLPPRRALHTDPRGAGGSDHRRPHPSRRCRSVLRPDHTIAPRVVELTKSGAWSGAGIDTAVHARKPTAERIDTQSREVQAGDAPLPVFAHVLLGVMAIALKPDSTAVRALRELHVVEHRPRASRRV